MSFSLTTQQFTAGTKTVTRRVGWRNLTPGDHIQAVEKAMGLRKGEKVVRLGVIEILSCRRERIDAITREDVVREGFPAWTPAQFVAFYCEHNKCRPADLCTRIEFRRVSK